MIKKNKLAGFLSVILRIIYIISLVAMVVLGILSVATFFAAPLEGVLNRIHGVDLDLNDFAMSEFVDVAKSFITAVMFVVVSRCLMVVLQTISDGTPFETDNAARFSIIAKVVVYAELAKFAVVPVSGLIAMILGIEYGEGGQLSLNLTNFLGAGIALVLAEVFREGARLREEQELTV
ncbi:DUF2975 domain-containing protein [Parvularcula sp. IMCC14364]|uniref:DUF2975 domain-containing protein n=1 Tax=Parvularcula sp. IMCC14364 TaxID=3067902 RepID=UPI002740AF83|nr:DUF2975 domain-containing protein [Parvularcula sp. IMCC14364]